VLFLARFLASSLRNFLTLARSRARYGGFLSERGEIRLFLER
jgi:hypothetical protein